MKKWILVVLAITCGLFASWNHFKIMSKDMLAKAGMERKRLLE